MCLAIRFLYVHRELQRWDSEMRVKWASLGYYASTDEHEKPPPLPFMTLADARTVRQDRLYLERLIEFPAVMMKNKAPFLLPICGKLKKVIKKAEGLHDGPTLFKSKADTWIDRHRIKHSKDIGFPDFINHGIRRSFNTELQRQRISQRYIDAALSHTVAKGVEGHYNKMEL